MISDTVYRRAFQRLSAGACQRTKRVLGPAKFRWNAGSCANGARITTSCWRRSVPSTASHNETRAIRISGTEMMTRRRPPSVSFALKLVPEDSVLDHVHAVAVEVEMLPASAFQLHPKPQGEPLHAFVRRRGPAVNPHQVQLVEAVLEQLPAGQYTDVLAPMPLVAQQDRELRGPVDHRDVLQRDVADVTIGRVADGPDDLVAAVQAGDVVAKPLPGPEELSV